MEQISVNYDDTKFLRCSIEFHLKFLNKIVKLYLDGELSSDNLSPTIIYNGQLNEISAITVNIRSLIVELEKLDHALGIFYLHMVNRTEKLLKTINLINSELLVIEDYLSRNKKIYYQLFQIYKVLLLVLESENSEYFDYFYNRIKSKFSVKEQKQYLIPIEDLTFELLELDFILTGLRIGEYLNLESLNFKDIINLFNSIEDSRTITNLRTIVRLKNNLRIIARRKLDSLNNETNSPSGYDEFLETIKILLNLMK